jgi:hypothetical protein
MGQVWSTYAQYRGLISDESEVLLKERQVTIFDGLKILREVRDMLGPVEELAAGVRATERLSIGARSAAEISPGARADGTTSIALASSRMLDETQGTELVATHRRGTTLDIDHGPLMFSYGNNGPLARPVLLNRSSDIEPQLSNLLRGIIWEPDARTKYYFGLHDERSTAIYQSMKDMTQELGLPRFHFTTTGFERSHDEVTRYRFGMGDLSINPDAINLGESEAVAKLIGRTLTYIEQDFLIASKLIDDAGLGTSNTVTTLQREQLLATMRKTYGGHIAYDFPDRVLTARQGRFLTPDETRRAEALLDTIKRTGFDVKAGSMSLYEAKAEMKHYSDMHDSKLVNPEIKYLEELNKRANDSNARIHGNWEPSHHLIRLAGRFPPEKLQADQELSRLADQAIRTMLRNQFDEANALAKLASHLDKTAGLIEDEAATSEEILGRVSKAGLSHNHLLIGDIR